MCGLGDLIGFYTQWGMRMKRIIIPCIVFAIALATGCGRQETPPPTVLSMKLQTFIGDVAITRPGGDVAPSVGCELVSGDILTTGKSSFADISYGDKGILRIGEKSKLNMASIAAADGGETGLDLESGKIYGVFNKLGKHSIAIRTPTAHAAVRGTSFSIVVGWSGSRVSVLKGSVRVHHVSAKGRSERFVDVSAGQGIELGKKEPAEMKVAQIRPQDIQEVTTFMSELAPEATKILNQETLNEINEIRTQGKVEAPKAPAPAESAGMRRADTGAQERQETVVLKDAEKEQKAKEEAERQRQERERRERVSTIPTM